MEERRPDAQPDQRPNCSPKTANDGAPNSANNADQTPPEDDLQPDNDALGPATGTAPEGTAAGIGHAAERASRASRTPAQARSGSPRPQQRSVVRRRSGATLALRQTPVRTTTLASRHAPPAPEPPRGDHPAPLLPPEPPPVQHPAPLAPPQPPAELGAGESDDENWTPCHLSAPPVAGGDHRPRYDCPSDEPSAATPVEPTRRRGARWNHLRTTGGNWPVDVATRLHRTPFPTQSTPMVSQCVNRGRWHCHELQVSILN